MVRVNKTGWDAVVICADITELATMRQPLNWVSNSSMAFLHAMTILYLNFPGNCLRANQPHQWITFRQELRPASRHPIITILAALKRDILPPHREAKAREYGEFVAAEFDGAHYAELSAKTRQGLREFWLALVRRVRDGRVELWQEGVREWRRKKDEMEEKRVRARERAYWALTGEGSDPGL